MPSFIKLLAELGTRCIQRISCPVSIALLMPIVVLETAFLVSRRVCIPWKLDFVQATRKESGICTGWRVRDFRLALASPLLSKTTVYGALGSNTTSRIINTRSQ